MISFVTLIVFPARLRLTVLQTPGGFNYSGIIANSGPVLISFTQSELPDGANGGYWAFVPVLRTTCESITMATVDDSHIYSEPLGTASANPCASDEVKT